MTGALNILVKRSSNIGDKKTEIFVSHPEFGNQKTIFLKVFINVIDFTKLTLFKFRC